MKTQSAFTIFHFWYQKMIFSFLFSYGSYPRPRSRTKRSVSTQTTIICCFWLLQTTYMEEMKAGSTGPPVQLTPLSPIFWWLGTFIPLSLVLPFSKRKGDGLKDPPRLQSGEVFSLEIGLWLPPEPVLADALPYLSNSGIIRNVI